MATGFMLLSTSVAAPMNVPLGVDLTPPPPNPTARRM
jgi:hypothetical protein